MAVGELEITSVDEVGRILIPKETRDGLGIVERTKLLITEIKENALILKKNDVKEMTKRLEDDSRDTDLKSLLGRVRDETDDKIERACPEIST